MKKKDKKIKKKSSWKKKLSATRIIKATDFFYQND